MVIKIGTATESKGEITRGWIKLIEKPTGLQEKLAVIIASGKEDGPTFLITGNVHGNETVGLIIIYRLIEELDLDKLKGRLVMIPTLNPTGHLSGTRHPQFDNVDPNRMWPDSSPYSEETEDSSDYLNHIVKRDDQPGPQERAWARIHKLIEKISPDFHIDLHTCSTLSIPYTFLDRVIYENDRDGAEKLFERTKSMVEATGLTIIASPSAKRILKYNLHRSTSSASLTKLGIPAVTFELGPKMDVEPGCRDAGIKALKNIMRWGEMINEPLEEITEVPVYEFDEMYRELNYPHAPVTGIVDFIKQPGDFFVEDELLAIVRNIQGERLTEIRAEIDGMVMAWWPGIAKYEGEPLGLVAVPDRLPFVVSWEELTNSE